MTTDQEKKFRLYPRKWEEDEGKWLLHNADRFFRFWLPEDFADIPHSDLRGVQREICGKTVNFIKCIHHEQECWQIMILENGVLEVDTGLCDVCHKQDIQKKYEKLKSERPNKDDKYLLETAIILADHRRDENILEYYNAGEIVSARFLREKLNSAQKSSPFYHPFEQFDQIDEPTKPLAWTVEGLIPDQSIVSFHGDRESLKSFCALDLALSVATGTDFFGHKTKQGPVFYLAPEGSTGLGVRRDAWLKEHEWFGCYVPFYKRGGGFSFTDENDRHWLANELNREPEFSPRLIIFDTLGQSLGAADENSASDINRIARYLNDLKIAHDCCFLWIDHSGHDGNRARGSSAKGAALDVEFHIKRKGDQISLRNTKMKDAPRAKTIHLEAKPRYDSLILEQVTPEPTHAEVLLAEIGKADDMREAVIRRSFYSVCSAKTQAAKQKAFHRALEKLVNDGHIEQSLCETNGELVLKTTGGHTHPPL
nr:hypothetical protein 5 [Paracoccaceae bacterium]